MLSRIFRRLVDFIRRPSELTENGERIDINLSSKSHYFLMDMYQKSHYHRYLFAKQFVSPESVCGDFACGSGYGSVLLAEGGRRVVGIDIKPKIIETISKRYANKSNVEFICQDLRRISYDSEFDLIVSFETIEHLEEKEVIGLLRSFSKALKPGGVLVFSTPYLQKRTLTAVEMGFHLTFDIDEKKLSKWLIDTDLTIEHCFYQNYSSHKVVSTIEKKDFILCIAKKYMAAS